MNGSGMVAALESGKRISSRSTFFLKRLLPLLWLGMLAAVLLASAGAARVSAHAPPLALLLGAPLIVALFIYALLRRLLLDLADAVYDEGDALRVRFGDEVERIPLENIINISFAGITNPPRATLTLREPCRFGREVTFAPIQPVFGPLLRTRNAIVTDLIERVDAARRKR
jgi:hypothetical protein